MWMAFQSGQLEEAIISTAVSSTRSTHWLGVMAHYSAWRWFNVFDASLVSTL